MKKLVIIWFKPMIYHVQLCNYMSKKKLKKIINKAKQALKEFDVNGNLFIYQVDTLQYIQLPSHDKSL